MTIRPYAESCDQNKEPILAVLREVFADCTRVLEIGSGTGQHAAHFAAALPHLAWQTSDLAMHHAGIRAWLSDGPENALPPLALDVTGSPWPDIEADAAFSANTAHIMSWPAVERMMEGIGRVLPPGGVFALYGPFNYGGEYTGPGNARFDAWLKRQDPASGVRAFEDVDALARRHGMTLWRDCEMPVDNRTLVWRKS